jgi:N-acetylglucosamine-6-sulfatase
VLTLRRTAALAVISLLFASCTNTASVDLTPSRRPPPTGSTGTLPVPPTRGTAEGKPNFLILLTDDQAVHLFNRQLQPVTFGELVDKGVNFTRAYDNVSLCCPARASILTGLESHNTGVQTNTDPLDGQNPIRPNVVQALQAAGYRTMLDGKYLNSESCDPQPGWDQWICGSEHHVEVPGAFLQVDPVIEVNGKSTKFHGLQTDILAKFAIDFMKENDDPKHPFFILWSTHQPHKPGGDPRFAKLPVPQYRPPSYDRVQTDPPKWMQIPPLNQHRQAYIRNLLVDMTQAVPGIDLAVKDILEALGSRADNTFVLFMTDNGYLYGEHRLFAKTAPYQEALRVPFVIRYPKLIPEDRPFTSDALVGVTDIAPTLMDLAGIPWTATDGKSLVPLLERKATSIRTGWLHEHCEADQNDTGCTNPRLAKAYPPLWGIVTERYSYIQYSDGEEELYDLQTDPYELTNLANVSQYQGLVQQLAGQLAQLQAPPPAPETTIVVGPPPDVANANPVGFTFFSQARTTTFQCRLTGPGQSGQWSACDSGIMRFDGLSPGDYTFAVQAIDSAGHRDPTPANRTFTIG